MNKQIAQYFIEEYGLSGMNEVRPSIECTDGSHDGVDVFAIDVDGEKRWLFAGHECDVWIEQHNMEMFLSRD